MLQEIDIGPARERKLMHRRAVTSSVRNKKSRYLAVTAFRIKSLAVSYSHMGRPHTTIGAERFHFRVRYGIGWFPLAIAARQTGWVKVETFALN